MSRSPCSPVPPEQVAIALSALLPGVKFTTPDSIGDAAVRLGLEPDWVMMPTRHAVDPFASLDAAAVLDMVLSAGPPLVGDLILITDSLYPGGQSVAAEHLRTVLESEPGWVGDDVVVLAPAQRRLVVIHHAGAYVHISA